MRLANGGAIILASSVIGIIVFFMSADHAIKEDAFVKDTINYSLFCAKSPVLPCLENLSYYFTRANTKNTGLHRM